MDLIRVLFLYSCLTLSGASDWISSVRRISVRRGQSIVIPCLYKQKYALSYKHLRSGNGWRLSDCIKKSDKSTHHKTVLISDDASRFVFTVRMDDVQESGRYWCAVEIPAGLNKRPEFFLEVTEGPPRLYVSHQNVTGSENGSVSITCRHHGQRAVRWCRFGGQCMMGASGTIDGASVEIRYDVSFMTVTISGLKMENTGWYCCSTADLQMPVHITVLQSRALVTAEPHHIPPGPRKRTVVLFLLPVILEVLLIIIIYSSLKLVRFCRERYFRSTSPAEESQYVTMHRKRSSRAQGCSAADGVYESMAELQTHVQREAD